VVFTLNKKIPLNNPYVYLQFLFLRCVIDHRLDQRHFGRK